MFNAAQIRDDFSAAAPRYDAHASLQRTIMLKLAKHCAGLKPGSRILDAGCGTGQLAGILSDCAVTQLDIAFGMCRQASANRSPTVNASLESLPFADASFDAVVCSLVLQWLPDWGHAISELRRVLRPGGVLAISTFGPDTLCELKESFAAVDSAAHVSTFPARSAFQSSETVTEYYPSLTLLMRQLKAIGARNKRTQRRRSLMTPRQLAHVEQHYKRRYGNASGLPATWEILYRVEAM